MKIEEAEEIWDIQVRHAAGEWRAKHGAETLEASGSSGTFTIHCHKEFDGLADEVKEALNPKQSRWLSRDFRQAVEAAL